MPVTAIIPTYNRAKYVRESLSSVLDQTLPPKQVIVVDDGSSDNTREVVAEFGSRVEYFWKPNGGKSTALNLALTHAAEDLIWIFDDDDIAAPNFLERTVRALRENPECGFAYGDCRCFTAEDVDGKKRFVDDLPIVKPDNLFLEVLLGGFTSTERRFVFQPGSLVRKSCYDEVGPFDESLIRSQDFEMLVRLAHRFPAVKVDGVAFHQRLHRGIRGSDTTRVSAAHVVEAWLKNEQKLLARIYETYALRDFVPGNRSISQLSDQQTFTALMWRCCIMARKGVWDKAAIDLHLAAEITRRQPRTLTKEQKAVLRLFFDLSSFAPHTFDKAADFRRALKDIEPGQFRRKMRASLLWPLPLTIGAVLLHRQYGNSWRFLRAYFTLATPAAILETIFSPSFFRAGITLIRSRFRTNSSGTKRDKRQPTSLPAV